MFREQHFTETIRKVGTGKEGLSIGFLYVFVNVLNAVVFRRYLANLDCFLFSVLFISESA